MESVLLSTAALKIVILKKTKTKQQSSTFKNKAYVAIEKAIFGVTFWFWPDCMYWGKCLLTFVTSSGLQTPGSTLRARQWWIIFCLLPYRRIKWHQFLGFRTVCCWSSGIHIPALLGIRHVQCRSDRLNMQETGWLLRRPDLCLSLPWVVNLTALCLSFPFYLPCNLSL